VFYFNNTNVEYINITVGVRPIVPDVLPLPELLPVLLSTMENYRRGEDITVHIIITKADHSILTDRRAVHRAHLTFPRPVILVTVSSAKHFK
jgi:hypothetical protein